MRSRLVVKPHRPYRALIFRGLLLLAFSVAAWLIFEYGRFRGGFDRLDAAHQQRELSERIDALEKQNTALRGELALIETSRDVDREAYAQVEKNLGVLQAQILEQRKELRLYRGIVSPADGAAGLRVQEIGVTPRSGNAHFTLRLVLVQQLKHDRRVSGVVDLSLDGAQRGRTVTYAMTDITPDKTRDIRFSFKYFQDFEEDLVLPDDFLPERIHVEIRPDGRSAESIRQSFDWGAIAG
ncbi:MAG TPA: DUF6776 family protein [Gammaproteobacteria bacterium]|nr:DUF6776 family protein [Gammaproteobacteria bacterium]